MTKVIVIGLQRTGTTSMGQALLDLGYKVVGGNSKLEHYVSSGQYDKVLEYADQFDAYQDLPWLFLYKELDKKYPNSKFILTKRDEQSWIKSMVNHFGDTDTSLKKWAYGAGCPIDNENLYLERFRSHYKEVEGYFKGRENDILTVELGQDQNWDKLCSFLDKPIPKKRFPFENKRRDKLSFFEKTSNFLKSMLPKSFKILLMKIFGIKSRANRFHTEDHI